MDISYYKKINKYISLKLHVVYGDKSKWIFAPKQSKKVSAYNDENEDLKIYDPIEKRTYVFPSNSKIESETISCALPSVKTDPSLYEDVDDNNNKFSTLVQNILDVLDFVGSTDENIDFLKTSPFYSKDMSLGCSKLIKSMMLFGVKDIINFKNNTPESLSTCKDTWKSKILQHADLAIQALTVEKETSESKNDLESSEEISIIIKMIEDVKTQVVDPTYFETSKTTDDLIKKWPPILLPVPSI